MRGGALIREARIRAGLSQGELAQLAGTTQSGISRWERGRNDVGLDEVFRLIRLCGFDLEVAIVPADSSDIAQAQRLLQLSPTERVLWNQSVINQLAQVRNAATA